MMVNPETIINYNLSDAELEQRLLFWICAAGKNGRTAARCLDNFLTITRRQLEASTGVEASEQNATPFEIIEYLMQNTYELPKILKHCGIGCYNSKARSFRELIQANLDLRSCSVEDLEAIHGIGPKTARCFILFSRKGARLAGLDTHMLKHLRSLGYDAPRFTPASGKKYAELEQIVLNLADEAGMTPAEYDLKIWLKYSVPSTPGGKRNGIQGSIEGSRKIDA